MRRRLRTAGAAVLLTWLSALPQAHAYTEPRTYLAPTQEGGGGGRFFTGSPAEGYACSVCHVSTQREKLSVQGLPEDGYVPGTTYELRLAWPELADRAARLRERDKGPPSMSLVTELVAESGEGAGVIETARGKDATKAELCAVPEGQQGVVMFALRPGEQAAESGTRCEANRLGQRCVAAVLSCGVREMRLRWTAPKTWQGAIWFSVGMVATDAVSGDPNGDSVTEVRKVLLPAASSASRYQSELRGSCAVARASATGSSGRAWPALWLLLATCAALGVRRLRARELRARLIARTLGGACAASLLACSDAHEGNPYLPIDRGDHPLAGLYVPGSTLGYEPSAPAQDAGNGGLSPEEQAAIEGAIEQASMQDRCLPLEGEPGTPGTLTVTFTSDTYGGFYEPKNCGAVWIEDMAGHYVATADVWAEMRLRNIFIWQARRCADDAPDAISSATLETHEKHEVTWDGRDLSGEVAPDGRYVLNIEVTEDELNYGRRAQYELDKNGEVSTIEPADEESVRDLVATWTPEATSAP